MVVVVAAAMVVAVVMVKKSEEEEEEEEEGEMLMGEISRMSGQVPCWQALALVMLIHTRRATSYR